MVGGWRTFSYQIAFVTIVAGFVCGKIIKWRKSMIENFLWYTKFILENLLHMFKISEVPAGIVSDGHEIQKQLLDNWENNVDKRIWFWQ